MMATLQWLLFSTCLLVLFMALRFVWLGQQLRRHPHVEPVERAKPEISCELNALVGEIAAIANIATPQLYIRRAALPNAFVVAAIARPELYLTDELLEHCCTTANPLAELTHVLAHEIAHIRRGDAIPLGLLHWLRGCAVMPARFRRRCERHIAIIEKDADCEARQLVQRLSDIGPETTDESG